MTMFSKVVKKLGS